MSTLAEGSVEALRARLHGALLSAGDTGFEEATRLWNGMISKTPAFVIQAADTADVVAAVNFARHRGVAVSVRGGGRDSPGPRWRTGG